MHWSHCITKNGSCGIDDVAAYFGLGVCPVARYVILICTQLYPDPNTGQKDTLSIGDVHRLWVLIGWLNRYCGNSSPCVGTPGKNRSAIVSRNNRSTLSAQLLQGYSRSQPPEVFPLSPSPPLSLRNAHISPSMRLNIFTCIQTGTVQRTSSPSMRLIHANQCKEQTNLKSFSRIQRGYYKHTIYRWTVGICGWECNLRF